MNLQKPIQILKDLHYDIECIEGDVRESLINIGIPKQLAYYNLLNISGKGLECVLFSLSVTQLVLNKRRYGNEES